MFDSAYYADIYDVCSCRHERGAHGASKAAQGLGHCSHLSCSCRQFILHGKVASPGPQGTRTPTPAYPGFHGGNQHVAVGYQGPPQGANSGPLAGGLGSGKASIAKVKLTSSAGHYGPTSGISVYDDPAKHWDVIIEFEVAYGATPTNHHMVELRLNIEREHAEVLLDGHEILDPAVVEAQVAAIRERILAEGSWAVAVPGDIDSDS